MFFEANQSRFLFSVPGLSAIFQVLRFHGEEFISQSFDFSITLLCEDASPRSGRLPLSAVRLASKLLMDIVRLPV